MNIVIKFVDVGLRVTRASVLGMDISTVLHIWHNVLNQSTRSEKRIGIAEQKSGGVKQKSGGRGRSIAPQPSSAIRHTLVVTNSGRGSAHRSCDCGNRVALLYGRGVSRTTDFLSGEWRLATVDSPDRVVGESRRFRRGLYWFVYFYQFSLPYLSWRCQRSQWGKPVN